MKKSAEYPAPVRFPYVYRREILSPIIFYIQKLKRLTVNRPRVRDQGFIIQDENIFITEPFNIANRVLTHSN